MRGGNAWQHCRIGAHPLAAVWPLSVDTAIHYQIRVSRESPLGLHMDINGSQ